MSIEIKIVNGIQRRLCGSGRWRLVCSEECENFAMNNGVCKKHGAKVNRCKIDECNNQARQGGVCIKHGSKVNRCKIDECNNQVKQGGVCTKHGAKVYRCKIEECNNQVRLGGVCTKHGAKVYKCKIKGCDNQYRQGGVCTKHGAKVTKCSSEGCSNIRVVRGKCKKHGDDEARNKRNEYYRKYKKENIKVRLKCNLRSRLSHALHGNYTRGTVMKLVGCSLQHLKDYLESQFTEGMTWDNYGLVGWHMDHIIPCASFDLTNEEEQRKCFHYTNLQPLWAKDNLRKGSSVPKL